jgi:uncharacterized protein YbaR (Trm112 family)/SAM-dependent methyltransferase
MKQTALDFIVCPVTKQALELTIFRAEREEIMEGALTTPDLRHAYPIIGGVPRLLPPELRRHLATDYPDFYATYAQRLPEAAAAEPSTSAPVQRHTQEAFGYEWTWAADYDADNFSDWLPAGHTPEALFQGKVGLEVGCGAGRHAQISSSFAQAHFAVDLSRAVDSAFALNRENPRCHVVQADAFHLPFRLRSFGYVYCLGVLQHMHDPPQGFQQLAEYPRPGGALIVNVYQAGRPLTVGLLSQVRRLTTRLGNEQLRRLSVAAGTVEYALFTYPWKQVKRTPLAPLLRPFVPTRIDEYARHSRRTAIVDWFDRLSCPVKIHYRREDLERWYRAAGYDAVAVTPYWKAFWNGYGERTGVRAPPAASRRSDTRVNSRASSDPMAPAS